MQSCDVILAGGGLANTLIAYRLATLRPELRLAIVEPDRLGGNHTWCFHATDLSGDQGNWIAPFVVRAWDGYAVRFPDRERRLSIPYRCITADRLREVMARTLRDPPIVGRAVALDTDIVTLDDGRILHAPLVLDGRGAAAMPGCGLAWQAFLGLELRFAEPHGLAEPIIMDATVPQEESYRFFYCLPLSDRTMLIEDTRYCDDRRLDLPSMRAAIHDYAAARGWRIEAVIREETGLLPLVLSGHPDLDPVGAAPVGMRAALFHPVTGYSLPDAVRIADAIAAAPDLRTDAVRRMVISISRARWRSHRLYRLLNRMLFMAGRRGERWRMLSRFYGLSEPLIARFYAGENTLTDGARLLTGRPPVSIRGALACLPPSSARAYVGPVARA